MNKEERQRRIDYTYALISVEPDEVKVHMRYVSADDLSELLSAHPTWITAWEHDMLHHGPEWCAEHDARMRFGR